MLEARADAEGIPGGLCLAFEMWGSPALELKLRRTPRLKSETRATWVLLGFRSIVRSLERLGAGAACYYGEGADEDL
jgi:hypothetical protein